MHIPYTYLIGWSTYNKWYYGVRFAQNCNPNDLWKTYFTSSSYVSDFRAKYGEPDIIQVRKLFNSIEAARNWENKILKKLNVIKDKKWLNQTNNISIAMTIDIKNKIGNAHKGKIVTEETKNKLRSHKRTNETKLKISKLKKEKHKGCGNPNYGNVWSDEQKKKLSEKRKGQFSGNKNPMFGKKRNDLIERNKLPKVWITNKTINKLILLEELEKYLQVGYQKGRIPKT